MKIIILAAGYGTRLKPLFDRMGYELPKPLLSIAGKPLIEHIIDKIRVLHPTEIFVVTNNYFYQHLFAWEKSKSYPFPIRILNDGTHSNEERLGAVGDIRFAIAKEKLQEDLFVIAGDNYFEFDLQRMLALFQEKQKTIVALWDSGEKMFAAKKFGVAELGDDNQIIGFVEKPEMPKTSLVSTACYFFPLAHLSALAHLQKDNLGELIRYLSETDVVYGCVFSERWCDIGTPAQYEQLEESLIVR